MKSIRTKLLILILSCVVISTAVAVSISVVNSGKRLKADAFKILSLECNDRRNAIDDKLYNVEEAVNTIYEYALEYLPDEDEVWTKEEVRAQYIQTIEDMAMIVAENTDGAVAVYYRFAPELVKDSTLGFFMVKDSQDVFQDTELTDISIYEEDDVEHVGWYYIPLAAGKPTWVSPYDNANVDISMISYVIPVYVDGVTIGVIGMDIEMELLYENVDAVQIYDSGYAFLLSEDGEIINHDGCPNGIIKEEVEGEADKVRAKIAESQKEGKVVAYQWGGAEKYLVSEKLANGMFFSVCVPRDEIEAPRIDMVKYSIASMLIVLGVFILLTIKLTRDMVKPLKELTKTAERIAASDLDIEVECKTKDEVGVLASSIQRMVDSLKNHISQINNMAYWDALTGLKSNSSYNKTADELEKQIGSGRAEFSLYVMDMNNLKIMNDTHGHKMGDVMLKDAADIMRKVWPEDSIYRIGGDEFAVILKNSVASQYQDNIKIFNQEVDKFNQSNDKYDIELQVAVGMAVYNKGRDENFIDVFRRADKLMYEDKDRKKHK